jgi:hypothetical protein
MTSRSWAETVDLRADSGEILTPSMRRLRKHYDLETLQDPARLLDELMALIGSLEVPPGAITSRRGA